MQRIFLFSTLCALLASTANAQTGPCLGQLNNGDVDPQPRSLRVQITSGESPTATITGCIISNYNGMNNVGVSFGVFDKGGFLLGEHGVSLGNVLPTAWTASGDAKIIQPLAVSFSFGPQYYGKILDQMLVTVSFMPCGSGGSQNCGGAATTYTFLAPAVIQTDGAKLPTHHHGHRGKGH